MRKPIVKSTKVFAAEISVEYAGYIYNYTCNVRPDGTWRMVGETIILNKTLKAKIEGLADKEFKRLALTWAKKPFGAGLNLLKSNINILLLYSKHKTFSESFITPNDALEFLTRHRTSEITDLRLKIKAYKSLLMFPQKGFPVVKYKKLLVACEKRWNEIVWKPSRKLGKYK